MASPGPVALGTFPLLCQALDHHRPGDGGSKKRKSHGGFQRVGRWQPGDADSNRDARSFVRENLLIRLMQI